MTNRLLLLALLLLLNVSSCFAQIQSEQGRLILNNGQELSGSITHFYDNPSEILLQGTDKTKSTYKATEVAEIQLADSRRFVVLPFNTNPLVFQLLVDTDKISLLKRETPSPEFYIAKDGQVHLLENNEKVIRIDGKDYKQKDNRYVGVLMTLLQDRVDLADRIQQTKLKEQDLAALVLAYTNGSVSYYSQNTAMVRKDAYWLAYAQLSNYKLKDVTVGPSLNYEVGAQYYFSRGGRSSLRFGLNYATHKAEDVNTLTCMLITSYQYDFVKTSNLNAYLASSFFALGYAKVDWIEEQNSESSFLAGFPINPGLGFEYKPSGKLSFYAELNQLLLLKSLPHNYSLGLKYAFSK
ncbi:MAG TPA: hypothetical protein VIG72_09615 [Pontibacter sp.]